MINSVGLWIVVIISFELFGISNLTSITGHPTDLIVEPLLTTNEYFLLNEKIGYIRQLLHPFPASSRLFSSPSSSSSSKLIKSYTNSGANALSSFNELQIGLQCKQFFETYHNHHANSSAQWKTRIEDASGKSMAGMMNGNLEFLGDFDECINVRVGTENNPWEDSNGPFDIYKGRYCTLAVTTKSRKVNDNECNGRSNDDDRDCNNRKILTGFKVEKVARLGICLLSACSKSDLQLIAQKYFADDTTDVSVLACDGFIERQSRSTPRLVRFILLIILCLLIIGSLIDLLTAGLVSGQAFWIDVLLAFSVSRNLRSILFDKVTPKKSRFINVFKGISMILVFHGHSHMIIRFVSQDAISKHYHMLTKPLYQMFIITGFLSVDLFLFISAFISVKILLPKFRIMFADDKVNFVHIIMNAIYILAYRYMRLIPSLVFLMLVYIWSENLMLGPLWVEYSEKYLAPCRTSWLPNVLMINNLLPWNPESPNCAFHSWHLGLDMQLFIVSLIFFIILGSIYPKVALSLSSVVLLASMISKGVLTGFYGYPPMVLSGNRNRENLYFSQVYTKPWFRADPYIIGLMYGYFCCASKPLSLSQGTKNLISMVVGTAIGYILIVPASFHTAETYLTLEIILYAACHRSIWALCLSWIFHCGFTNDNSLINRIAQWHIWEILSNISYQFFLFHPILFFVYFGCTSIPLGTRIFLMLMAEPGGIIFTILVSLTMALVVEWPVLNIMRIVRYGSMYKLTQAKLD